MMRTLLLMLLAAAAPALAQEQLLSGVINAYMPVVAIDTCGFQVVVESSAPLAPLDRVLVIQATGAIVDSTNSPAFGSLLDFGGAGRYELGTVRQLKGDTIVLFERLLREYDPRYTQVVRVPRHNSARVVAPVTALPWDGRVGGVVALEVLGTLTLDADIDATSTGLRGGHIVMTALTVTCDVKDYFVPDSIGTGGGKGEGIARLYDPQYSSARGAIANGGGGGNDHNSGGGGGGNGGVGGIGGNQWSGCLPIQTGGVPGRAISHVAASDLLFFGGGGGSGHANNNAGVVGGNGGGLVLVRAYGLEANGNAIIADGQTPPQTAGNDGAGGAGGGGTVVLDVDSVLSPLVVSARGGRGSYGAGEMGCHGPGGGGGGGAIYFSSAAIPANVSTDLAGGQPGMILSPVLPCYNTTFGAEPGEDGIIRSSVPIIEGHQYPTIELPELTVEPGDTVDIAVRLRPVSDFAFRPLRSVELELLHDARLLMPMDGGDVGAAALDGDSIHTLVASEFDMSTDTIATFRTMALLGHVRTALVEVVDAAFAPRYIESCPARGNVINGLVNIIVCEEGSERLVRSSTPAGIKPVAPNPVRSSTTLRYTLAEHGATRLLLRDGRGDVVRILVDGPASPGEHALELDVENLPSGLYSVELVTPTERASRNLHVIR
jgi:hypothetical protein